MPFGSPTCRMSLATWGQYQPLARHRVRKMARCSASETVRNQLGSTIPQSSGRTSAAGVFGGDGSSGRDIQVGICVSSVWLISYPFVAPEGPVKGMFGRSRIFSACLLLPMFATVSFVRIGTVVIAQIRT
jgi:hypothetical protein